MGAVRAQAREKEVLCSTRNTRDARKELARLAPVGELILRNKIGGGKSLVRQKKVEITIRVRMGVGEVVRDERWKNKVVIEERVVGRSKWWNMARI